MANGIGGLMGFRIVSIVPCFDYDHQLGATVLEKEIIRYDFLKKERAVKLASF